MHSNYILWLKEKNVQKVSLVPHPPTAEIPSVSLSKSSDKTSFCSMGHPMALSVTTLSREPTGPSLIVWTDTVVSLIYLFDYKIMFTCIVQIKVVQRDHTADGFEARSQALDIFGYESGPFLFIWVTLSKLLNLTAFLFSHLEIGHSKTYLTTFLVD